MTSPISVPAAQLPLPAFQHFVCFVCRAVLIDGIKCMVKTTHSVLLCFMFGPTGLLSHTLTKAVWGTGPSKHKVA